MHGGRVQASPTPVISLLLRPSCQQGITYVAGKARQSSLSLPAFTVNKSVSIRPMHVI